MIYKRICDHIFILSDMKKILVLVFLFAFLIEKSMGQDYLTMGIISTVRNIKVGNTTGTGFLINYNNYNYLVTAKHVLGKVNDKQKLFFQFYEDSVWVNNEGTVLLHTNHKIDIAVLDLNEPSLRKNQTELTIDGVVYGEEGYFLGFPYELRIDDQGNLNSGLPLPLVKKVVLSAIFHKDGISTLFLDGQNNPGFSGGPIILRNIDKSKEYKWKIVGVVSGYRTQKNELDTPFGKLNYVENSGIMIGYGIDHVIEIIETK